MARELYSVLFASLSLNFTFIFLFFLFFILNFIAAGQENNQNINEDTIRDNIDYLTKRDRLETNPTHFIGHIFLKFLRCSVHNRIRDADVANRRVSFRFQGLPGRAFVCSLYYCQY